MKHMNKICLIVFATLISSALIVGCGSHQNPAPTNKVELPVGNSGKHLSQYTWEEYLAMDEKQKLEFQQSFGSQAIFEAWKEKAQRGEVIVSSDPTEEVIHIDVPWDEFGAKTPSQYTWEEFEELSAEQQMVFQNSFDSIEAFDAWMQSVRYQTVDTPWEKSGAKQPVHYTWEEFETLTPEQQIAFQNSFFSIEAFDAWLQKAQNPAKTYPWEKPGAKQPKDYTWAEFEALNAETQMAFQNSFDSVEAFDAWMQKAQNPAKTYPWEKLGAKQPKDYTWAEFEALSAEEQMAFQNSFKTQDDFDTWLEKAQNPEKTYPWDKPGAKQPKDYTWAEFEALTGEEQMAFQNSFESIEAFDAWLQRVNP